MQERQERVARLKRQLEEKQAQSGAAADDQMPTEPLDKSQET